MNRIRFQILDRGVLLPGGEYFQIISSTGEFQSGNLTQDWDGTFYPVDGTIRRSIVYSPWDDQLISHSALPDLNVGEVSSAVTTFSSSGLQVSITSNSNTCSISGFQIIGIRGGICSLTFVQSGNGRYRSTSRQAEIRIRETTTIPHSNTPQIPNITTIPSTSAQSPAPVTSTPLKMFARVNSTKTTTEVMRNLKIKTPRNSKAQVRIFIQDRKICTQSGNKIKLIRLGVCRLAISFSKLGKTTSQLATINIRR